MYVHFESVLAKIGLYLPKYVKNGPSVPSLPYINVTHLLLTRYINVIFPFID